MPFEGCTSADDGGTEEARTCITCITCITCSERPCAWSRGDRIRIVPRRSGAVFMPAGLLDRPATRTVVLIAEPEAVSRGRRARDRQDQDYRAGNQQALNALMGMVMKSAKGLNPKLVQQRLKERLSS